jgi:hypothetical protein
VLPFRRDSKSPDEYRELLSSYNVYRQKTAADQIREALVNLPANPINHDNLLLYRYQTVYAPEWNGVQTVAIEPRKARPLISEEKAEHVKHIKNVVFEDLRQHWPLSDRAVHYALLNYTFMRNLRWWDNDKGDWVQIPYANNDPSYAATCDLLMRLRLPPYESIPWEALDDPTRPVKEFHPFSNVKQFVNRDIDLLFKGYWRSLLQTQPNYYEVVCEKNSVYHMVLKVTTKYQINTMSGRGFTTIDPWHDLYLRYKASKKERCIVIMLTDYDPAGERMVQCGGQTLRDDFGVVKLEIIKAVVTRKQVEQYSLPTQNFAKEDDPNRGWFIASNGGDDRVWELEALKPEVMMSELDAIIQKVIDINLYNDEVANHKEDEKALAQIREKVIRALTGLELFGQ